MHIVGHVSPDWDCIGALWLLQRFGGFASAEILFVNTGSPDGALLDGAAAVVDTGRVYDPTRLRFDHHQLPGTEANATSACQQVYHWLILARPDVDWSWLSPIVDIIYAGDTGKPEANESRTRGIHALLSARKAMRPPDTDLLIFGYDLLDMISDHLQTTDRARATLGAHTVYRSADGLVVALKEAPPMATKAAHDAGARLVVFQASAPETNAIGVWRGGEGADVHAGHLINIICTDWECGLEVCGKASYEEMSRWYRHEAGFFAGRGTAKAPDPRPIDADLADIAQAIDCAWVR